MQPTDIVAATIVFARKPRIAPPPLEAIANPYGEGDLVFAPSQVRDARQLAVWLVVDDKPYTLTSQARALTPKLRALHQAPSETWKRAGFSNAYDTTPAFASIWWHLRGTDGHGALRRFWRRYRPFPS